ncbi:PAS domain S-box protein [Paenibacillus silvisoli]|uniref:PAS domain S-box protein n=1 Tax=Paenibacillus silvisoli TaxID=3110539 RepID=UPI002803F224|nr:PAS domain S-box protein [Paenibacillus silvisoli]
MDLHEQNEMLARITDAFFAVNNDWEFTYVNEEASRLLCRKTEDLIGKCMWSEFPEAVHTSFYSQYQTAMHEQIRVEFDAYYPPLAIWFDVRAYPSSSGLSIHFHDISQKKGLSLQKEQHYESLFISNPDAVFAFDLEGHYVRVNPAMEKMLGYRSDELLSKSFMPLIPEEELAMTKKHFTKAAQGCTQHYETRAFHKNGMIIDVKATNIPIIVNDKVVGVYGIAKDITDENKNKTMLVQAEKLTAVGQLAASIAHEIRNPLTSLKGFIQLIERTVPEARKSYFKIIQDELKRIEVITSELLYLAKPQAQEFKPEQISRIIDDVVMLMGSQALIKNIELHAQHLEILPAIECVGIQLKQVFINLIKNAMEAMPDGGKIQIIASRPNEDFIAIQVIDEGQGIPPELIARIGSPFYTTKETGTGLGMMATMQIIHAHNGTLDISSREGQGTTIHIRLPVASSNPHH